MKIYNKQLNIALLGAEILAILAFGVVIVPSIASADTAGRVTPYNSTRFSNVRMTDDGYNTYSGSSVSSYGSGTVYSSSASPIVYPNTPVATKTTVVRTSTSDTSEKSTEETGTVSDLAATAVFGADTFMPSGLIGWIILAILILFIVILARKSFGGENKYHSTPLKQA